MLGSNASPFLGDTSEHECTPTERANQRRYRFELLACLAVYFVTLFVSVTNVDRCTGSLKVIVALAPMIGVVAFAVALYRFFRHVDEMQRQMFTVAGAIAASGTALVTLTLGFLENAGVTRVSMIWVWPMTALIFGIAVPIVRRRYR
jgi:hypothetical protein